MWAGVADLAELDPESINPDDVVNALIDN